MRPFLLTLGWLTVGLLGLVLLLRLTHLDERSTLALGLVAAAPVLLLPAWLVLPGAVMARQWALGGVAGVLVAVHVVVLAPLLLGGRGAGGAGTPVRVMALNVLFKADDGAAVSAQVRAADPDVVVLSEVSRLTLRHLDLSQYPYTTQEKGDGGTGSGIWSRYPLTGTGTRMVGPGAMSQATVMLPDGRRLRVRQVHTQSPTAAADRPVWLQEMSALAAEVQEGGPPTVTTGDFNATREHSQFTALLGGARRVVDAADGHGLLPTWPSGKAVPPVMRLDHVLVTDEIGVTSVRVLGPTGSDHRAVLADLVVH